MYQEGICRQEKIRTSLIKFTEDLTFNVQIELHKINAGAENRLVSVFVCDAIGSRYRVPSFGLKFRNDLRQEAVEFLRAFEHRVMAHVLHDDDEDDHKGNESLRILPDPHDFIDSRVRRRTYSLDRSNVLYWRVTETPRKPEEQ